MGRASPALTSTNAGELSPRLEGRVDTEKYQAGLKVCENFLPLIQGPATRRGGTRYIAEVKDSGDRTWLVRFEFSTEQAYILEFGDGYIRFFTNQGQVESSPGVPYEIASPYSVADLITGDATFQLRTVESADVIYICHPSYQQRKLTRLAPTNWTIDVMQSVGGPFKPLNTTATTVQASATTGAVTLTASAPIFSADLVGSLFYLEEDDLSNIKPWESYGVLVQGTGSDPLDLRCRSGAKTYQCLTSYTVVAASGEVRTGTDRPTHVHGSAFDGRSVKVPNGPELAGVEWEFIGLTYGAVLITGYTDSTHVTGTVVAMRDGLDAILPLYVTFTSGVSTTRWAYGAWSDAEGWPTHVAFFRERLTFGRGQQVWMSTAADFENFNERDDNGLVVADAAISLTLSSPQVNDMTWMETLSPSSEALIVGTAGGEFAIKSQTESQPFGTDNVTAQPLSNIGSRNMQPVKVGTAILYVQRLGTRLRDLVYDAYGGNQGSNDQTLYAEHVPRPKLDQLAYQQDPNSIIWAVRSDGQLVAMTYSREQYANPPHGGWHRHPMINGVVECIACIPGETRNELWMIVRRTIGGVTKRYVELLEAEFADDGDIEDAFFVDSGISYSGAPATVFSGLDHLIGQTVAINADGAARPQQVVSAGGSITLEAPAASTVHVGLPVRARLQTMRLNAGARDGTSQGKKSRIPRGVIRLLNTVGLRCGPEFADEMDEIPFRTPDMDMDGAIPAFSGDKEFTWPASADGFDSSPWLCFESSEPLPCTIVAVFPQVLVEDKG